MNRSARRLCFFFIAWVLAALPQTAASQQAAPIHLTLATLQVSAEAPVFIAMDKGYYKDEGLDVDIEFPGNATTNVTLLSTGKVDVIAGSPSPALWNAVARGVPLKIVLPIGTINGPHSTGAFTSGVWMIMSKQAAASGQLKTFSDLRGKTIAVPGFGLSGDIVLDHALKLGGLTRHDVNVVSLSFDQIVPALSNGAVDAAIENEPFVTQGVQKGYFVRWKNGIAIYPGQVAAVVAYGPSLLQKGGDVGTRLAIALTRAARDYNAAFGPKHVNMDQIVSILTKYTTEKDPALYPRLSWNYLDPNCSVDEHALQADLDWYAENGYVRKKPDVQATVDGSYCAAALKALGRYRF